MTSGVMDAGNGTYLVSAHAAPARGGAAGATRVAYSDAQKFCTEKGAGMHAVVLDDRERDVYQGSFGGSYGTTGGGFGGGVFAAGNTNLRFKCDR